jgi:hypothetical protein
MRLGKRLEIDAETASQTYYACLLFYVGCTANADIAAEIFGDHSALTTYGAPVRFGSRPEMVAGLMRAVAPPGNAPLVRARQLSYGLPRLARVLKGQRAAVCEVAQMLTDRLGLPTAIGALFTHVDDRWDGKGEPGRAKREAIPLPVRIVQVARDAALQRMLGGSEYAAGAIRERAGRAFDPVIARRLADEAAEILALDEQTSAWDETLACEPTPRLTLVGEANDRALAAMGDFADLASPYLVGHPGEWPSWRRRRPGGAVSSPPTWQRFAAGRSSMTWGGSRPHRHALSPERVTKALIQEVRAGRLDADAVTAVLEASGQRVPPIERPAGLTERESEVVAVAEELRHIGVTVTALCPGPTQTGFSAAADAAL